MQKRPLHFHFSESLAFADSAGDWNPIHVDTMVARRSLAGAPIVHGIDAVLRALNEICDGECRSQSFQYLEAVFNKPVLHADSIWLEEDRSTIDLVGNSGQLVHIKYAVGPSQRKSPSLTRAPIAPDTAAPLSIEDMPGQSGIVRLPPTSQVKSLFPSLAASVDADQIAFLMASSRLVGMIVPGLDSLYSEISVRRSDDSSHQSPELTYAVKRMDKRFRLATIAISGAGLTGIVKAFVRPEQTEQATMKAVNAIVEPIEFDGKRVLVVGGSRGLGETCAKLLAAGGAEVLLTYHRGEADAHRVAKEIGESGGLAQVYRFDAMSLDDSEQFECLSVLGATHMMYFATPKINGRAGVFQPLELEKYIRVYVSSFGRLAEQLVRAGIKGLYYPSTVFIDDRVDNLVEYTMAKVAGEEFCRALKARNQDLALHLPRLPKMATDQTASLVPENILDSTEIMLAEIRSWLKTG